MTPQLLASVTVRLCVPFEEHALQAPADQLGVQEDATHERLVDAIACAPHPALLHGVTDQRYWLVRPLAVWVVVVTLASVDTLLTMSR